MSHLFISHPILDKDTKFFESCCGLVLRHKKKGAIFVVQNTARSGLSV